MVESYHINFKLILFVIIVVGVDRILSKTNNYKIYKKIIIVLSVVGFVISAIYGDDTTNSAMSVIVIGYFFEYFSNRKKNIK